MSMSRGCSDGLRARVAARTEPQRRGRATAHFGSAEANIAYAARHTSARPSGLFVSMGSTRRRIFRIALDQIPIDAKKRSDSVVIGVTKRFE